MKTTSTPRSLLQGTILGAALLLFTIAPVRAAVTYHAAIDTSALVSNTGSGPFYLDFGLTNGSVFGNNTVTVSNFAYTGGTIVGSAVTAGGASGSLSGTVTLNDSAFFNDIYQGFTQTTTGISFDVTTTTNVDGINSADPTDLFSFTVLDKDLNNITTSHLDGVSLFTQPIDFTLHDSGSFAGSSPAFGTGAYAGLTVDSVPEPSRALLLVGGLVGLVLRRRRRC